MARPTDQRHRYNRVSLVLVPSAQTIKISALNYSVQCWTCAKHNNTYRGIDIQLAVFMSKPVMIAYLQTSHDPEAPKQCPT